MAVRCKHHPSPAAAFHCKTSDISGLPLHLGYPARRRPPCHHNGSLPLRLLPHPWIRKTSRFLDVSLTRLRSAATEHSRLTRSCSSNTRPSGRRNRARSKRASAVSLMFCANAAGTHRRDPVVMARQNSHVAPGDKNIPSTEALHYSRDESELPPSTSTPTLSE
ncbi:hypothetical protein GWK47_048886 [Chionoecetes opilio]|uniref:Uncharacterized protein n=1 Tax=Chionoecetes opilio TaxID=41210 RepID=A0A8J5CUH1_CHIOP|nr:hypothetical protein GWK47_048886 [Chionoecetes opilio]